jgi:starch phosphorylase
MLRAFNKEKFKEEMKDYLRNFTRKQIEDATIKDLYGALAFATRDMISDAWIHTQNKAKQAQTKTLYYLSMEFLVGRALGNNLLNLGIVEEVKEVLDELNIHFNLSSIEEFEADPGLGNGGLGRLAACFLDSLSTLSYFAYGCGIRYHYGIFKQKIENGFQVELPDYWLEEGNPWEIKHADASQEIKFGGSVRSYTDEKGKLHFVQENYQSILAIPYDMPVVGYKNEFVNTLTLWDAEAPEKFVLRFFDEGAYEEAVKAQTLAKTLVEVLYPNDNHYLGKELRLKQQYFFVSASIQRALARFKKTYHNLFLLPEKVVFQLNDTHPSIAIPELMRILLDEEGLSWEDAFMLTSKTCAYTNHTIMTEALETWPVHLFSKLLPRVYQIVEEINRRFCDSLRGEYHFPENKIHEMSIIADGTIRMAHLAIVGSFSINGVAKVHTQILKETLLSNFYAIWPDKFSNKTNGITQRRWLAHCNKPLSHLITQTIGDGWITDLNELKRLKPYADDASFKEAFAKVKLANKINLATYIGQTTGIIVDPSSIFDMQIKRLHEYKRQLMNVLHIMMLYNEIKENPHGNYVPRTFIFGAKAAPGYRRAKLIIKLIHCVSELIAKDPIVSKYITVVFIENYNVSMAELLIPAANVSEQISTASKEASGTGNMKFMLNGAITMGTLDGATIEIVEEIGRENAFIFGLTPNQVLQIYKDHSYRPSTIYLEDTGIHKVLRQLINGTLCHTNGDLFAEIYESLLNKDGSSLLDPYLILKDLMPYYHAQKALGEAYRDENKWNQMAVLNTAGAGKFSSDRTICEYAKDIWNLTSIL